MGMAVQRGWAAVAVGRARCASPSFSAAADLVKISIRVPEGTQIGDKLGKTEEFARILLGARVQAAYLPSSSIADKSSTLRYGAPGWNQAATPSQREAARAGLLRLWGPALTIESPDIQVRPDPYQAIAAYLQPKKESAWRPAFGALGLVDAPAFRSGNFTQAYDNGRALAAAPVAAPPSAVMPRLAAAITVPQLYNRAPTLAADGPPPK